VLHRRKTVAAGTGWTVDISAAGACFIADGLVQRGDTVELVVDWPAMLDGQVPLELATFGEVVWVKANHVGLWFLRQGLKKRPGAPA